MPRGLGCLITLSVVAAALFFTGRDYVRRHPQDVPWTALDLDDPVGRFTASKIAGLDDETARCRDLLSDAPVGDSAVPPRRSPPYCGYENGMRLDGRSVSYNPDGLVTSCPVAAALFLWENRVVQPAAQRHFGSKVTRIDHGGSYSCRRLYGRETGAFSEHATADAIDVTGFQLDDGELVRVLQDWKGWDARSRFLSEVRDGACEVFSTVLSPDYNEAHRDHLHFDVASRGGGVWTMCR
ncbi:MAG: extensin family protein [Sphingomicrobium sp.]